MRLKCDGLGCLGALIDFFLEFGEMAAELGAFRRCVGHHFGEDGPVEASMDACEKQGCSETELGDSIAVSFGDSLDHAVRRSRRS